MRLDHLLSKEKSSRGFLLFIFECVYIILYAHLIKLESGSFEGELFERTLIHGSIAQVVRAHA